MSNYPVLQAVSRAIRSTLWREFEQDEKIKGIINNEEKIDFKSPADVDKNGRLSLWLYHITENEYVSNQPMRPEERQPNPLALHLHYLITPFAGGDKAEDLNLLLLGKTMQVLHRHPIFEIDNRDDGIFEQIRLIFNQGSLEELARIWGSLNEPYRLSVCYQVKIVRIDSTNSSQSTPVH